VSAVHVVVPAGIDDPGGPSGGNTFDRAVCDGLPAHGWAVRVHEVAGPWPRADRAARVALTAVLAGIPDGAVVLLDGLVACALPEVLVPARYRLRTVVLVHLPQGHAATTAHRAEDRTRERGVLQCAAAVVSTSRWTREWLVRTYCLAPGSVHVVTPGVASADLVLAHASGGRLLCVAAVAPHKGHDVLVEALAAVKDLSWSCTCVGSVAVDASFTADVRTLARAAGLGDRIAFSGPLTGDSLSAAYAAADLVLVPSRTETYGMVVTEALARGIPVVGSDVGGLPEALDGPCPAPRPGILVAPGDAVALAGAVRRWLTDPTLRHTLQAAAAQRRTTLSGWAVTARELSHVLAEVAA